MYIIDAHEDIAINALYATSKDIAVRHGLHDGVSQGLFSVNNNVDLPRMHEGGVKFVFGAIFSPSAKSLRGLMIPNGEQYNFGKLESMKTGLAGANDQIKYYRQTIDRLSGQLEFILKKQDYYRLRSSNKIGLLLHSEGVDYWKGVDDIEKYYKLGLRSLALTWRNQNKFGSGNNAEGGLTTKGKTLIKKTQAKGIIVDLAHANQETFFDLINVLEKPVMVSHTNCASLCENSRNITDEQINLVAETNGVIGIAAIPEHIGGDTIDDYVNHIIHVVDLVGSKHVCFGTDFDGMVGTDDRFINDFAEVSNFPLVVNALRAKGLNDHDLNQICFGNLERLILANLV